MFSTGYNSLFSGLNEISSGVAHYWFYNIFSITLILLYWFIYISVKSRWLMNYFSAFRSVHLLHHHQDLSLQLWVKNNKILFIFKLLSVAKATMIRMGVGKYKLSCVIPTSNNKLKIWAYFPACPSARAVPARSTALLHACCSVHPVDIASSQRRGKARYICHKGLVYSCLQQQYLEYYCASISIFISFFPMNKGKYSFPPDLWE